MDSTRRAGMRLGCCGGLFLTLVGTALVGPALVGSARADLLSDQQTLTRLQIPDPPTQILPYRSTGFLVRVVIGDDGFDESSARVHYRIAPGPFESRPLQRIFTGYYYAPLPPAPCPGGIDYFVTASTALGRPISAPATSASQPFQARTDVTGLVPIAELNFNDGLPAGWRATGLWSVTSGCAAATLDAAVGSSWAYFGLTQTCSYDTGFRVFGALESAPLQLPNTAPHEELLLEYWMRKVTEDNPLFDLADLSINGVLVDAPPDRADWIWRTVDLSEFAGLSIVLHWQFDTVDDVDNDHLGWQIGAVRIRSIGQVCPPRPGDMNCDGVVDFNDFSGFVSALVSPAAYAAAYPGCDYLAGDFTGDQLVLFDDIDLFIRCLTAGGACELQD